MNRWLRSWSICQIMGCPPSPIGHTHASSSPDVMPPPSSWLTPISLSYLDCPIHASHILPVRMENNRKVVAAAFSTRLSQTMYDPVRE
jgi:hypothetical protein